MEVISKGFPNGGIHHRTVKLQTFRKMTVSLEEYELVIQHRKDKIEALRPGHVSDMVRG